LLEDTKQHGWLIAPEGRKKLAHGVSHGNARVFGSKPRRGGTDGVSSAPYGARLRLTPIPMARAMG
jgi:hypothetical protein